MRQAAVIGALLLWSQAAAAAPVRVFVEPVQVGVERLDALHAVSGLESRSAVRLGGAVGVTLGRLWQVALGAGTAAGTTDFGLLDGPSARLVRTEATLEVRGRVPARWHGFGMQAGLGIGWLSFGYRPDRIVLNVDGMPLTVELAPVRSWTQQVAAELLHSVPRGEVGVRCAWRFYDVDVATPGGLESRSARDLQLGMLMRVMLF